MDSNDYRLLLFVVVAVSLTGLVLTVIPTLAPNVPIAYPLVVLLGVVAAILAVKVGRARYRIDTAHFEPPAPELRGIVGVPGSEFDEDLTNRNPGVRARLRSTTIALLSRLNESGEEEAEEKLADGTWTDNPRAAAFFSGEAGRNEVPALWRDKGARVISQCKAVIGELAARSGYEVSGSTDQGSNNERPLIPETNQGLLHASRSPQERATKRWRGLSAFVLLACSIGILFTQPVLLLVGGVGAVLVVYVSYWRVASLPSLALEVERNVPAETFFPGDEVPITVTIRNVGEEVVPDLRFIDGVPTGLCIADGSPRYGTHLRPNQQKSFSYTVEAAYGTHTFQSPLVIVRDVSGQREVIRRIGVDSDDAVQCRADSHRQASFPLLSSFDDIVPGDIPTATGGRGVEFFSIREYRQGDPPSLVDWNRLAREGSLSTIEFNRERSAAVLFVIDSRQAAHVASSYQDRSAVDRSREAVARITRHLVGDNVLVGLTSLSSQQCWLPLGSGTEHSHRIEKLLAEHPSFTSPFHQADYVSISATTARIRQEISGNIQIVFFSPLTDDIPIEFTRRLVTAGFSVAVISPDPTGNATPGQMLAKIERDLRLFELRAIGIRGLDWANEEAFETAVHQSIDRRQKMGGYH